MLSLLMDKDFWIMMICIVCDGLLVWAWIKFKSARVVISTLVVVVVAGFTVYAGFYINSYYSAEGGIYGQITNLFNPSLSVSVEDLSFDLSDIQLTQENDSDIYSATFYTTTTLDMEDGEGYAVCVNKNEVDSVITSSYIQADYTVAFYNQAQTTIIGVDTLHIRIALNLNTTNAYVYTENGSTYAKYWSQYFKNNSLTLTLVKSTSSSTITYAEEDIDTLTYYRTLVSSLSKQVASLESKLSAYEDEDSPTLEELQTQIEKLNADIETLKSLLENYAGEDEVVVYFYFDDELYASPFVTIGSTLADLNLDAPTSTDDVVFNYWMVDGEQIDDSYTFTTTTTVTANVTYYYDVIFYVGGEAYSSQKVVENGYATLPVDPTKVDYTFSGWSLDGETVVDVTSMTVTGLTTYYAVFEINSSYVLYTDLSFSFNTSTLTASVSASSTSISGTIEIPETVTVDFVEYTVTSVKSKGFYDCTQVTSIVLPDTLSTINSYGFYNCTSLSSVSMPSTYNIGNYAFYNCTSLKNFSFSNDLYSIGKYAFSESGLTSVTFPDVTILSIDDGAFYNCTSLSFVKFSDAFDELYLPRLCFGNCTSLKTIWLPSGFEGCEGISVDVVPFYGCSSSLVIYLQADSTPDGCSILWNVYDDDANTLAVKYGYSYSDYLSEIS